MFRSLQHTTSQWNMALHTPCDKGHHLTACICNTLLESYKHICKRYKLCVHAIKCNNNDRWLLNERQPNSYAHASAACMKADVWCWLLTQPLQLWTSSAPTKFKTAVSKRFHFFSTRSLCSTVIMLSACRGASFEDWISFLRCCTVTS